MASKLSPSLKALVNKASARPGQVPAPRGIQDLYRRLRDEARERKYGDRSWLVLSAAATFTLNSPESLCRLHAVAAGSPHDTQSNLATAETIREVGLKCISFNGIPRTINCLTGFTENVENVNLKELGTRSSRAVTVETVEATSRRGRDLWRSIYVPFDEKLEVKLAKAHPDLPVHILGSHYGPLLANPEGDRGKLATIGRNLTSVVAISCLRAQTGVGPQVLSHVFGLRKGVEQGTHKEEFAGAAAEAEAIERLASDEGCEWLLESVDAISGAIGSNFAQHSRLDEEPPKAKL
ncbi:hypothetical protein QBC34DRAFT_399445 [Podospora aff. communis PSN243]|uniref:Dol-P-Man:Man(5)GlcNAc(2)-PP-Dol alpha-1,3-mannosyltransferase n=1 Tax=Podospora aff. communis PSN243 TaxID=3040156 RepID=A0AAV9GWU9_9PEZI|nr:hypothetical protein QBC34DRAFT_399445 [Podospora aff. communis PSN243]